MAKRKRSKIVVSEKANRDIDIDIDIDIGIISSLPDEVVGHIISFLPFRQEIKEAIKTCILSTRWREIYTLDLIDDFRFQESDHSKSEYYPYNNLPKANSFMDFVDWVWLIWQRIRIVDKLSIRSCRGRVDYSRLHQWILSALDNKVRELELDLHLTHDHHIDDIKHPHPHVVLPIELLTCNTLEVLRLTLSLSSYFHLVELPTVPVNTTCFPSLKSLNLCLDNFLLSKPGSFSTLISSCSVLEELFIERCSGGGRWKFNVFNPTLKRLTIKNVRGFDQDHGISIEAPNLVYFNCHNQPVDRFVLKNLNSIVQVYVSYGHGQFPGVNFNPSTAIQIFQGIKHAQSLHLSSAVAAAVSRATIPIPKLPNLTCLCLDLFTGFERLVPDLLLPCFPRLEALHLEVNLWFLESTTVTLASNKLPSSVWSRLKTLTISSFRGKDDELIMAKYFLEMAGFMEELTIEWATYMPTSMTLESRSNITATLMELPKLSKNCKILVVNPKIVD